MTSIKLLVSGNSGGGCLSFGLRSPSCGGSSIVGWATGCVDGLADSFRSASHSSRSLDSLSKISIKLA